MADEEGGVGLSVQAAPLRQVLALPRAPHDHVHQLVVQRAVPLADVHQHECEPTTHLRTPLQADRLTDRLDSAAADGGGVDGAQQLHVERPIAPKRLLDVRIRHVLVSEQPEQAHGGDGLRRQLPVRDQLRPAEVEVLKKLMEAHRLASVLHYRRLDPRSGQAYGPSAQTLHSRGAFLRRSVQ